MTAPRHGPTFDPAPLIVITGNSLRSVAHRIGVDPACLCRPLSPNTADRYAGACGYHPCEIWGSAWFAAAPPDPDWFEDDEDLDELLAG